MVALLSISKSQQNLESFLNREQACWTGVAADPSFSIIIRGHSDRSGSPEINMKLSWQRAEATRDFFLAHGFSRDRIKVVGYGDTAPLLNAPGREPQNRRATVSLARDGVEQWYF
jgi:outer membrane protein OmpA-like peptidoglycan-associated protein